MGYILSEGALMLNISFKISRNLRQKIDESINKEAIILVTIAAIQFTLALFFNKIIWDFIRENNEEKILSIFFAINLLLNTFIIVMTASLAGRDCIITNSCFFFLMSTLKIYSFFLFKKFFRETEISIFQFCFLWLKSKSPPPG